MFVGVELRQPRDLATVLRSHLGRLVPDDVPLSEAPEMWDTYDEIERCTGRRQDTVGRTGRGIPDVGACWRPVGGRVHGTQGRKLGGSGAQLFAEPSRGEPAPPPGTDAA
jgi:hypothetical protein